MTQRYKTLADFLDQTGTAQEELAAQLGISTPYISLLRSRVRSPSLELALRIHELTGVPFAAMVKVARGEEKA